jgi:hypothetical protein
MPARMDSKTLLPTRPASQWPVGARLRFRPDALLDARHEHLRGTAVIVLSEISLVGPAQGGTLSWRQEVLSFAGGCRTGWARPDQLTLPLDDDPAT